MSSPDQDTAAQTEHEAVAAEQAQNTEAAASAADPLAEAQAKAAEHYELYMRAMAEMENLRRRTQDEVAKAHKFAIEGFAEHLIPVVDSLHAALGDQSAEVAKVREGVELTLKQLTAAFEKGRITELNPVGEKFDPHRHQAIAMVPSEQEPNTVVAVLQRGYMIAERVLRPALVTVSQAS